MFGGSGREGDECVHRAWEVAGFSKRRPEPPAQAGPGTQHSSQGLLRAPCAQPRQLEETGPGASQSGVGRRSEKEVAGFQQGRTN